MGNYYIGISGWRYAGWRKTFYPEDLPQRLELEFASEKLRSIEINGSFYSLQTPSSYKKWYESTPDDFVFSVKAPRYITHIRRLVDVKIPVANFFASGVLALREKLGPILWQLPPSFKYDPERLETFFKLLPRTTNEARVLAMKADRSRLRARVFARIDEERPLRHALEVRNPSFEHQPSFLRLLKRYKVALVCADAAKLWPFFDEVTSDFFYARLHGGTALYVSQYGVKSLKKWAKLAKKWHGKKGRDVYIYFDNDAKVHAPFDAMKLREILHIKR